MGLIENIERGLEKAVRGVFTAGSKNRIEPVDLASRLRSEMDRKSYAIAEGRTIAPNIFTIEFSDADFPRAQDWGQDLAEELCDVVIRHARSQGYTLRGAVRVTFTRAQTEDLNKGEFLVISAQERAGRSASSPRPDRSRQRAAEPARSDAFHRDGRDHRRETDAAPGYAPGYAPDYSSDPLDDAASAAPAAAAAASSTSLPSGSSRIAPRVPSRRGSTGSSRSAGSSRRDDGYSTDPRLGDPRRDDPRRDDPEATQAMGVPGRNDRYSEPHRAEPTLKPVLDISGQRFSIQAHSIVLGRSSEADITIEDTGVSRRHLEILNQDGVFLAVDLGSTNGSSVDGRKLHGRRELVDGSVITMGRTKITFRLLAPRSRR